MGSISGIYYENSTLPVRIKSLGVTSDTRSTTIVPLTPQYHVCDYPSIASPNFGLFLSVAVLSDFKKIDVCHVANRCTGMLIHYFKSPAVVLGQWRIPHESQQSCIYNASVPAITNIHFTMAKYANYKIVTNISASPEVREGPLGPDYKVFSMGQVNSVRFKIHTIC